MRRSRRNNQTTFSLFAFQDIITSVTGICIFLTLVLVLQWINAPAIATLAVDPAKEQLASLDASIEIARRELRQLDISLETIARESSDATRLTPVEIQATLQQLQAQRANLESEKHTLRGRQIELESTRREIESSTPKIDAADELQQTKITTHELREKTAHLKQSKTLLYTAQPGANRLAWIVDISNSGLSATRIDQPAKPVNFAKTTPDAQATRFHEWSLERDSDREYFMLLVRPSGVPTYEALLAHLIEDGFKYGIDLIDENASINIRTSPEETP